MPALDSKNTRGAFSLFEGPTAYLPKPYFPAVLVTACKTAGIPLTRACIQENLIRQIPKATDLERWDLWISKLGDADFEERDQSTLALMRQGPALRCKLFAAAQSSDPEVARRCQEILNSTLVRKQNAWMETAVAWLIEQPSEELHNWLLAYIPWAEQSSNGEQADWLVNSLLEVSERLNSWQWIARVNATHAPLLRLAAAKAFTHHSPPFTLSDSAASDSDPRVQLEFARQGVIQRNPESARHLAKLIELLPTPEACQAEEMLVTLSEMRGPVGMVLRNEEAGCARQCSLAWLKWLDQPDSLASWGKKSANQIPMARTLVVEFDGPLGGRIVELGPDWKTIWEMNGLGGPNDVQILQGGKILVAERTALRVTERNRDGKICWEHAMTSGPISSFRTRYGSTVIASFHEVIEVDRAGNVIRQHTHPAGFRHVKPWDNMPGNSPDRPVCCMTGDGQIQFLDNEWKVMRTLQPEKYATGAAYWASMQHLTLGKTLVSLGGSGKIVEVDDLGKIKWEASVQAPVHAQRLANGNTLVCSFDGRALVELDKKGKEIGRLATEGRPFLVLRH